MTSPTEKSSPKNRARRHFLGLSVAAAARLVALSAMVTTVSSSPAHAGWWGWWKKYVRPAHGRGGGRNPPGNSGTSCLLRGTAIMTPRGEVPIEALRIGDMIETIRGRLVAVRWIGRHNYRKSGANWLESVMPIRIAPGALGHRTPRADLYLSPNHALFVDGALIRAKDLVNGTSIAPALPEGCETIEYFNIVLDTHEVILANGAPAETFLVRDNNYECFANFAEYSRLNPNKERHVMTPFAPILGYEGGRENLKALLLLGASYLVAVRDPVHETWDRLAARGEQLAG